MPRAACRWEVANYRDYRVYDSGLLRSHKPRCLLLLQVDGNAHAGEGFRLSLEGNRLEADIWTSDVFAATELGGYRLRYEVDTSSVEIRPNTLASRWEDIITLVGKGVLVPFRPDAAEDCTPEFRQQYAESLEENPSLGAAIRWAVQATAGGGLRLVLQCLPATADRLRAEPRLSADEAPAIILEAMDLETEMLEGDEGPGPVPILFSRDPAETRRILGEWPDRINTGEIGC